MRLNPQNHITIEIRPYSNQKRARHKHGCTHLVRVWERQPFFADPPRIGEEGVSTEAGKVVNIFEQEITVHDSNDLANALRRYGDWQRPPRKRKPKRRNGPQTYGDAIGGGYGTTDRDYREA